MTNLPAGYRAAINWQSVPASVSELFSISAPGEVPVYHQNDQFVQKTSEHYRFNKDQLRGLLAYLFSASKGDALLVHGHSAPGPRLP